MATIKKTIDVSVGLTEKQKKMLEKASIRAVAFDEDNPPLTKEELAQFKRKNVEKALDNPKLAEQLLK